MYTSDGDPSLDTVKLMSHTQILSTTFCLIKKSHVPRSNLLHLLFPTLLPHILAQKLPIPHKFCSQLHEQFLIRLFATYRLHEPPAPQLIPDLLVRQARKCLLASFADPIRYGKEVKGSDRRLSEGADCALKILTPFHGDSWREHR